MDTPKRRQRLVGTRVRLYRSLRTAHLERAHELLPAAIVYRYRRYDFDEGLITGLELVRAGPVRAAWLLVRSPVDTLEINEPLMLSSVRSTALVVLALRMRSRVGGRRTSVVTYAIGNTNPWPHHARRGVHSRVGRSLDATLARYLWRRTDRIVYGTREAERTYSDILPALGRPGDETIIPALPCRCSCLNDKAWRDPNRLVFLGAFAERKGFALLLEAWPLVRRLLPEARMTLLGKGPLVEEAEQSAQLDPTIDLIVDPPRPEIHRRLAQSGVLTLPSQPTANWREQVGLPIVEGLAHGCTVVTTEETGLAGWLGDNGHQVLTAPTAPVELAQALVAAFRAHRSREEVLASLPQTDGRLDADAWLFGEPSRLDAHALRG